MRLWLFVVLSLVGLGPVSAARADRAPEAAVEELRGFADRFDRAQIARDKAALDRMVVDDLVFITGTGQRQGKAEFIAGWTEGDARYEPIQLEDRVILPLGPDAGIANAAVTLKGVADGKSFSHRIRFADIFHRVNGEWRVVHIQVTRLP